MKIVRLDKRLAVVASFVRQDAILVDVGTDHGYLIGNLAYRDRISGGVACDVNEKPLEKAKRYTELLGVSNMVECVLSNGFETVRKDFDDAVIAGMGGDLILRIILAAPWTKDENKRLILQPMSKADVLRLGLWDEGYSLVREEAVSSAGKCYSVMIWKYTGEKKCYSIKDQYLGEVLGYTNEDTNEYLTRLLSYLQKKICGIEDDFIKCEYLNLINDIKLKLE